MNKTEVFFRIVFNPFVFGENQTEELKSTIEFKSHKEAKREAESAGFAPNEYKIIRCERKVI